MARHCPECGFVNGESANYCQKCGAFLGVSEPPKDATTATYRVSETGEFEAVELDEVVEKEGAALVIRAGGGRVGESFALGRRPADDRPPAGRRRVPRRRHGFARPRAARARAGRYYIDDCGSLNGTYVNRKRIDSHAWSDGDELQIGKYKLAFLAR